VARRESSRGAAALTRAVRASGLLEPDEAGRAAQRLMDLWARFRPGPAPTVALEAVESVAGRVVRLDGMVVATLCPHHLVPARAVVTLTCWPLDRVAGIGALARLVAWHALRPALHEDFAAALARDAAGRLGCDVEVAVRAVHVCAYAGGGAVPEEVEVRVSASPPSPASR
jgi:GTP cyclohydrolase I